MTEAIYVLISATTGRSFKFHSMDEFTDFIERNFELDGMALYEIRRELLDTTGEVTDSLGHVFRWVRTGPIF